MRCEKEIERERAIFEIKENFLWKETQHLTVSAVERERATEFKFLFYFIAIIVGIFLTTSHEIYMNNKCVFSTKQQ